MGRDEVRDDGVKCRGRWDVQGFSYVKSDGWRDKVRQNKSNRIDDITIRLENNQSSNFHPHLQRSQWIGRGIH